MRSARTLRVALVVLALFLAGCATPEDGNAGDGNDASSDGGTGSLDGDGNSGDAPGNGDGNDSGNGGADPGNGDAGNDSDAPVPSSVGTELVVDGLAAPVFVTTAPGEGDRLFVVEQHGRVRVVEDGSASVTLLDIMDRVKNEGEQGHLGLAFHPDWAENGRAFVHYSDREGDTVVSEFTRTDDGVLDAESERVLLTVDQPYANHNGGMIAFAPPAVGDEGAYLYIALGDGGAGGDPHNHGQNPATLLGSILRIDVDGGDADQAYGIPDDNPFRDARSEAPEVWAFGLRNPWRFSFDRETGDLWIADVGQNAIEEVNVDEAPLDAGLNYGWNAWEGDRRYSTTAPRGDVVMPVHAYTHDETSGCSVTGGYAYRGTAIDGLQGAYVFSDYCAGTIWALVPNGDAFERRTLAGVDGRVTSFGEDAHGEILVVVHDGRILRLVPDA